MNKFLFILCFISAINAQFDPPDTQYKGFSKINCLGLIISGLDDSVLLSEIEKSFFLISEKTLSKEIAFGPLLTAHCIHYQFSSLYYKIMMIHILGLLALH